MHPRNAYREKNPDFAALAKRHPALLPHLRSRGKGRHVIDFTSYDATRELNAAMLAVDYGILRWTVPPGHLIPPVANRANYVHWIQDLLRASRPDGVEIAGPTVLGLDVGVGANCVYPLIGAATHGWRFVGCDVADAALAAATANASANANVASLIEIRDSRRGEGGGEGGGGGGVLLPAIRDGERFAFSMCNPPFFETMAEAELNAGTNFGGTETEMCYPNGGEHAFVRAMYEDSLTLRDRVHWYTTMCGKKETMKKLRRALEMRSSITFRTTEFLQGRTTRWGIAWSFAKDALEKTNRRGASNANALDAATTAAATPKCWRMTFEVQARARGRAGKKPPTASDVLERLRRELSSATTTSISIETDASDPLRLNCALELPSPSPSSTSRGPPHAFTASVMRSAPGTLTVAAALAEGAKSRDAAKTAFATAMARARAAMRSPETYE
jgi:23S rRNA (adenine1618-N6)-methyltransferase